MFINASGVVRGLKSSSDFRVMELTLYGIQADFCGLRCDVTTIS